MKRGTIHLTFTYQSSKPWTTHVNLHSVTFLVFQRTTVLFYRNKVQSLWLRMPHHGQIPYNTCCNAPWEIMGYSYMHHGGCSDTEAQYEAEEPSVTKVRFLTHICAHLVNSNLVCIWTWEKWAIRTGSYMFAYSGERPGSALLPASVVLAVSLWLFRMACTFIYEVVMWGIQ